MRPLYPQQQTSIGWVGRPFSANSGLQCSAIGAQPQVVVWEPRAPRNTKVSSKPAKKPPM